MVVDGLLHRLARLQRLHLLVHQVEVLRLWRQRRHTLRPHIEVDQKVVDRSNCCTSGRSSGASGARTVTPCDRRDTTVDRQCWVECGGVGQHRRNRHAPACDLQRAPSLEKRRKANVHVLQHVNQMKISRRPGWDVVRAAHNAETAPDYRYQSPIRLSTLSLRP